MSPQFTTSASQRKICKQLGKDNCCLSCRYYIGLLALLIRALCQPPVTNMSDPVEESLDVLANCTYNELVVVRVGHQRKVRVAASNSSLRDIVHSFLFLSFFSSYVALYLLVCNVQMLEDVPVQEPIQCTSTGNGVSVIRGKDYPPPVN